MYTTMLMHSYKEHVTADGWSPVTPGHENLYSEYRVCEERMPPRSQHLRYARAAAMPNSHVPPSSGGRFVSSIDNRSTVQAVCRCAISYRPHYNRFNIEMWDLRKAPWKG